MRIFETIKVFPMVIIPSLAIVARDAAAAAIVIYSAWAGAAIGAIGVTFTLNIAFAIKCPRRTVRAEHRADRAEIVVGALQCPDRKSQKERKKKERKERRKSENEQKERKGEKEKKEQKEEKKKGKERE